MFIEEAETLNAAAIAITNYRKALAWGDQVANPTEDVDLRLSWTLGADVAGYEELRLEIQRLVAERMVVLVPEALTRLRDRAIQAQRKASLVSVEPAPAIVQDAPRPGEIMKVVVGPGETLTDALNRVAGQQTPEHLRSQVSTPARLSGTG